MTSYKLFRRNETTQVLGSADRFSAQEFAIISNTPKGWIARREPGAEGVNVQHMINQPNGAELIAQALGL